MRIERAGWKAEMAESDTAGCLRSGHVEAVADMAGV